MNLEKKYKNYRWNIYINGITNDFIFINRCNKKEKSDVEHVLHAKKVNK